MRGGWGGEVGDGCRGRCRHRGWCGRRRRQAAQDDREAGAAGAQAVDQVLEGGEQGLGDVGEGADQAAGGDAVTEEPGGGGEEQHDRQLAADRQGRDAQDTPAGQGTGGAELGVDEAGGVGGDLFLGTGRRDVAQPWADRAEAVGEGFVGEEEGLLPPGQRTQGRREEGDPGEERGCDDEQEQRVERTQPGERAHGGEQERPGHHHQPGEGVPGQLHLLRQPGQCPAVALPHPAYDDPLHEPVPERFDEIGDTAIDAPGTERPDDHPDPRQPEPTEPDGTTPDEKPRVQRTGEPVADEERLPCLQHRPEGETDEHGAAGEEKAEAAVGEGAGGVSAGGWCGPRRLGRGVAVGVGPGGPRGFVRHQAAPPCAPAPGNALAERPGPSATSAASASPNTPRYPASPHSSACVPTARTRPRPAMPPGPRGPP